MTANQMKRFEELRETFNELDPDSDDFVEVFMEIREMAENGLLEATDLVAEICAFDRRLHDPEAAYKFYNIAKAADGFSVRFKNLSDDPSHYTGEVGDFRNEPQVSDLIDQLGFERCLELDAEADEWRSRYSGN
jgi:hypothetical protein